MQTYIQADIQADRTYIHSDIQTNTIQTYRQTKKTNIVTNIT